MDLKFSLKKFQFQFEKQTVFVVGVQVFLGGGCSGALWGQTRHGQDLVGSSSHRAWLSPRIRWWHFGEMYLRHWNNWEVAEWQSQRRWCSRNHPQSTDSPAAWERPCTGAGGYLWRGLWKSHNWAGEKWKEEVARKKAQRTGHYAHPLCCSTVRGLYRSLKWRSETETWKRVRKGVVTILIFFFFFSLPKSILTGNKINCFCWSLCCLQE